MRRSSEDLYRDSYAGGRVSRLQPWRVALQVLLVLGAVVLLFAVGDYFQRLFAYRSAREVGRAYDPSLSEVSAIEPLRSIALNSLTLPRPWEAKALLESGLPVYDLRIASEDLTELQQTAERVMAQTISSGIPREYVPAEFLIDSIWEPIDVKLRGLYSQHYIKTRPSLRLKFPSRKLFHGAKQINLLDPYDKGLTIDATTAWEFQQHGLLAWDSRFVVLRLNDEVVGVFQEIEQFGRSMTDRNLRPEGPIFSGYGQVFGKQGGGIYEKARVPLQHVQACLRGADSRFEDRIAAGSDADDEPCDWAFLQKYFQLDRWAWAAALSHFLHSSHAWHPDNVRLFWDPARGQFEPIPWDYGQVPIDLSLFPDGEVYMSGYSQFFLAAPEFRRMRDERLWQLLQERVEPMAQHSQELFESLRTALSLDRRHPDFAVDEARQAHYIATLSHNRAVLEGLYGTHELLVHRYPLQADTLAVQLENRGKSFLKAGAVVLQGASGTRRAKLAEPVVVDGVWKQVPGTAWVEVAGEAGEQVVALEVVDGVSGARVESADVQFRPATGEASPPRPSPPGVLAREPSAPAIENVHSEPGRVRFGPGPVELGGWHEFPSSVEVVFEPGLELRMKPGAALMIYGDLSAPGTAARPIRVSPSDPEQQWQGIFVQGTAIAKSHVQLRHTTIDGGIGGENDRSFFTSGFAVHDAIVELADCEFLDSGADDGLNLKYAEVLVTGTLVRGSRDDALDCDFCSGELRGNTIRDAGGDGFDFSGSRVLLTQNRVERCGDKGMSIGEKTMARVFDNDIRDCYTGIAVKDLSEAEVRDLRLSNLKVGVAAYIKKPTFGPSRVTLSDIEMADVGTDLLRDESCVVEREGVSASTAALR